MIDKKIFVIGSGRCGTTWLGRWLRQHPETFGGPETHLFSILKNIINPEWEQGIQTWVEEQVIVDNVKSCLENIFELCKFRKPGQNHLIEHSWVHYETKDFIKKIFPDAIFVHIYRDGRNVVESKLRSDSHYRDHIDLWMRAVNEVFNQDESTINIKYEDLVANPSESQKITSFLGLDHHQDIDSWEFPVNTPYFEYNPDRWKTLSEDIQSTMMEPPMLDMLKRLGYE